MMKWKSKRKDKKFFKWAETAWVWWDFHKRWHHRVGKLLHVFSYQLLTSEVLAVFVLTEQISHQNTPKKPCVPFPMRNLYASVCTCAQPHTAADRYSRFHEAGSHEGSLTKDCGSAGRKWSTPLDMNRKQPGKRTLTGHTHSELWLQLEHWTRYKM